MILDEFALKWPFGITKSVCCLAKDDNDAPKGKR
jgi:hypothetical protein